VCLRRAPDGKDRHEPGRQRGAFFFLLVVMIFVYRSFYGMRIPEDK